MRFTTQPEPKLGDKRTATGFLWFPKRIGNQTRWLERAMWTEEVKQHYETNMAVGRSFLKWKWTATEWVNP